MLWHSGFRKFTLVEKRNEERSDYFHSDQLLLQLDVVRLQLTSVLAVKAQQINL